jgi:hypothetical protein
VVGTVHMVIFVQIDSWVVVPVAALGAEGSGQEGEIESVRASRFIGVGENTPHLTGVPTAVKVEIRLTRVGFFRAVIASVSPAIAV